MTQNNLEQTAATDVGLGAPVRSRCASRHVAQRECRKR